jgi:hypothetical protein
MLSVVYIAFHSPSFLRDAVLMAYDALNVNKKKRETKSEADYSYGNLSGYEVRNGIRMNLYEPVTKSLNHDVNYIYHLREHSSALHSAHSVFVCSIWFSQ